MFRVVARQSLLGHDALTSPMGHSFLDLCHSCFSEWNFVLKSWIKASWFHHKMRPSNIPLWKEPGVSWIFLRRLEGPSYPWCNIRSKQLIVLGLFSIAAAPMLSWEHLLMTYPATVGILMAQLLLNNQCSYKSPQQTHWFINLDLDGMVSLAFWCLVLYFRHCFSPGKVTQQFGIWTEPQHNQIGVSVEQWHGLSYEW